MLIRTRRKDVRRLPIRMLAAAGVLAVLCATLASAQSGKGVIRVEVTDSSGGRLPGVAVVATAPDGQVLATATTDGAGRGALPPMPAGPVMLRFRLEGFAGVLVGVTVASDAESRVVQALDLAPLAETVVVAAPAPVETARPAAPPPVPPSPRAVR